MIATCQCLCCQKRKDQPLEILDIIHDRSIAYDKLKAAQDKISLMYRTLLGENLRRSLVAGERKATEWVCLRCDGRGVHYTTATPLFCDKCRDEIRADDQIARAKV